MSEIIEIMKNIAEKEISKKFFFEIGVVTSVFPRGSEGDKNNFECNVKLFTYDIELRKVPVLTQQVGLVNMLSVGDLVVVGFINGDINFPFILGIIYNDEDRVPVGKDGETIYKPPPTRNPKRIKIELPSGANLTIKDDEIIINWNNASLKINSSGSIEINSSKSIKLISDSDIEITSRKKIVLSSGKIDIGTVPGQYGPQDTLKISSSNIKMESWRKTEISSLEATIKSNTQLDITANTFLNIRGGAMVNIKGGIINLN